MDDTYAFPSFRRGRKGDERRRDPWLMYEGKTRGRDEERDEDEDEDGGGRDSETQEDTANTYVGDEFVRGVSGGERKRVSIAEMMATRAHVLCFDNSTRGLDASTALDFIKALRVMTNVLGQTTFATL
ncbi:hypothetical protein NUW54_g11583 [Trametes sanguinea]|uniref:Uncharacterized protein n=1 Tax=Trametes sanguinea TaxID=158606 RepID=A0ACC1NAK8_9APHY|nr:hypothetical protein NUW54_g11583 [Trametes sanguinea]